MNRLESLYLIRDFVAHEIEVEQATGLAGGAANPMLVAISLLYDVDPALVVADGRGLQVTKVRHCLAWMLRRGGMSLAEIAHVLGYSDRTTAGYACARIDHDAGTKALLLNLHPEGTP